MSSEATQSSGMVNLLTWIEVNKRRLLFGGGAGLVAIFLIFIFVQHQAEKEHNASEALSNVRLPYSAGTPPQAGTADALLKVAEEHKGTKAAARALLLSAAVLFAEAKTPADYAQAQQRFNRVIQDYPDSQWMAQAHLGVAAALAAEGKAADATTKYEEVRRRFGTSAIADETKLALARLYESPKPEESFKLYEELIKESAGSVFAMEANMRQEELVKAHPELAKLKEPPPSPIMPTANPNQPIKITPMTNRVTATNVQRMTLTNRPGTSQPVEIKLNPSQPPAASTPAPGPTTPPAK